MVKSTTIIRRPMNVSHGSMPDYFFGETTAVGVSETKSDYDYNYKTEFQIWKEYKEIEHQNMLMSWPPLESISIGMNVSNADISHLDSTPVGMKTPDSKTLTLPTEFFKRQQKPQK